MPDRQIKDLFAARLRPPQAEPDEAQVSREQANADLRAQLSQPPSAAQGLAARLWPTTEDEGAE